MRRILMTAVLAVIPIGLFAARLTLRDGTVVTGRLVSGSPGSIVFQDDAGMRRTFYLNQVATIDFNPVDAPASAYDSGRSSDQRNYDQYGQRNQQQDQQDTANRGNQRDQAYGNSPAYQNQNRDPNDASNNGVWATLQPGTGLSVRTNEDIDSQTAVERRSYSAFIQQDILDPSGEVVIPRGAEASLFIRKLDQGGTFNNGNLVLDLESVTVSGRRYAVATGDLRQGDPRGIGTNTRTAEMVGGGAILGTLLGAIAGGGKGAAIGALAGAVAGGGVQVLTKGREIRVPAETVLNFRLEQPLNLREM